MRASEPLKSKRFATSLLAWSTALRTSIASLSETTSNDGMSVPSGEARDGCRRSAAGPSRAIVGPRVGDEGPVAAGSAARLERLPALERGQQFDLDRRETFVDRAQFPCVTPPGRRVGQPIAEGPLLGLECRDARRQRVELALLLVAEPGGRPGAGSAGCVWRGARPGRARRRRGGRAGLARSRRLVVGVAACIFAPDAVAERRDGLGHDV